MKRAGFGWLLVPAAYAVFALACAAAAVAFPAMWLWFVRLWRAGTALCWLALTVARMVVLTAVLLNKNGEKR